MEIKILENKEKWNNFLDNFGYLSFLQDYEYGEVEKSLKREIIRLGFFEDDLVGVCQLIGYFAKRGNILAVLHGPVIREEKLDEALILLLNFLKENKLNKKYHFLRINSVFENKKEILEKFLKNGFIIAPTYIVSENFWLKEIKDDDEMLKQMNKTTRNLILEAIKKPYLEIEKTTDLEKFEIFWNLYEDLYKRKKFVPYPKELIKKEFEIFSKENKALMFLGKMEGKYYSSALVIFSHKIAFYHHSASLPTKEPINYKIQWEIIQEAKKRGCRFYNFWGLAKKEVPNHPWYGLTQFKKGFGGFRIDFLSTMDFPFKLRYWLIAFYEKIKRRKL